MISTPDIHLPKVMGDQGNLLTDFISPTPVFIQSATLRINRPSDSDMGRTGQELSQELAIHGYICNKHSSSLSLRVE